jgi:hypothetical protein
VRENWSAYADWLGRKPAHPDLRPGDWVKLLPAELGDGTIIGKINWEDGSRISYAIYVPYGEDGALIYVHKADVEPIDIVKWPGRNEH